DRRDGASRRGGRRRRRQPGGRQAHRRRASRRLGRGRPRLPASRWGGPVGPCVPVDHRRRVGRAGMSVRSVIRAQWPILLVGLIFLAALALVGANFWRRGALLIGMGGGGAAMLRLVLPVERAGLLV